MHFPTPDQLQAYAAAIVALGLAVGGVVTVIQLKVVPVLREIRDAVDGNTADRRALATGKEADATADTP